MLERRTDRHVAILAVLALVVLAYSLLIARQFLLGILAIGALCFVYLGWRLIRALERIARALESDEGY